jgi:transposase
MIRREFGVDLSLVQVGRVLHDIGLSPQPGSTDENPEFAGI